MNRLRINNRDKDSSGNREEEKEPTNNSNTSKSIEEEIQYFINKNSNEFTEEDIRSFENTHQKYIASFSENTQKISSKLFSLSRILISRKNDVIEDNEICDEGFDFISQLPDFFSELKPLIQEVIEDNTNDSITFLKILINELIQVEHIFKEDEQLIENVYNQLCGMLNKLQSYNISQQKYIYRSIATCISKRYSNYCFISPEDGDFVDPKFHRIVSGNGQRILRGLSFILTDKSTEEVLKFGNIKTI